MSENIYSWEFEDKKERWTLWYVIALSIVIWLSIWWFFTKQYTMSFIVLLISWLVYFVENNSEDIIKVKITELWVKISWVFYSFSDIKSFGIVYKWEDAKLLRLNLNKRWIRTIDLIIDNSVVSDIKEALSFYIEEAPKTELTISEKFIEILKL